jgi:predicted DNA binding CopG/RHH family protein
LGDESAGPLLYSRGSVEGFAGSRPAVVSGSSYRTPTVKEGTWRIAAVPTSEVHFREGDGLKQRSTMAKKHPPFKNETQEAEWWAKNQNLIADRFEQAEALGELGKGTVARVPRERASQVGASPTITIRLAEEDLTRARRLAAERGMRYQTYLKMLLHQALNSEEKRAGRR